MSRLVPGSGLGPGSASQVRGGLRENQSVLRQPGSRAIARPAQQAPAAGADDQRA
jgi:hypothetical protein